MLFASVSVMLLCILNIQQAVVILALQTDDEEESFILEDPFLLNIDNTDTHSYDTSSVASSDSGDRTHLKRYCSLMP